MLCSNESYFETGFDKLDCSNQSFKGVEFEACQFKECDFSSSTFHDCRFLNCEFEQCNLSLIQVPHCRLFDVSFTDCKLIGVDWTRATWAVYHRDFELMFQRCVMNDGSFFGLTLNELHLEECKLHDVDFREGDFTGAIMRYCDFSQSVFGRTNLENADLSESSNYGFNVLENRVKGAKFTRYEALNLLEYLGIELVD